MAINFEIKAIRNTEICKKQANFNQKKPKNKQPASLQKKPQIHQKTSPNLWENRKVSNTGVAIGKARAACASWDTSILPHESTPLLELFYFFSRRKIFWNGYMTS